jgi:hypothetical protein
MSHFWEALESVFLTASMTMMPVTSWGSWPGQDPMGLNRRLTVLQLFQRFKISKGMAGCAPWPALNDARESKTAEPSCKDVSQHHMHEIVEHCYVCRLQAWGILITVDVQECSGQWCRHR